MKWRLVLISFLPLLFSCAGHSSSCIEETVSPMKVEFYRVAYDENAQEMTTKKCSVTAYIQGIGSDSLLCEGRQIDFINLPLRKNDSISQFYIEHQRDDTDFQEDTLTIKHRNNEEFISLECGCGIDYSILEFSTTTNGIDSVVIKSDEVTRNSKVSHAYIYFK